MSSPAGPHGPPPAVGVRWCAAAVALGLAARLVAAVAFGETGVPLPGAWDQVTYDALARRVLGGHGFTFDRLWWPLTAAGEPTAHWSFLYTGWIAAGYWLFGPHPVVVRLLQALLTGLLMPWGAYRLARRLGGESLGLWAAALTALYAYFAYYAALLMTEAWTLVVVLWFLAAVYAVDEQPTARRWLALGLLAGIAALLRQVVAVGLGPVGLWLLWRHRSPRRLAGAALALGAAVAVVMPVTLRNLHAFGRLVPVNTNAGFAFFWANHPVHGDDFVSILPGDGNAYRELIPRELWGLDEATLSSELLRRGVGFVRADPRRYARLCLSRIGDFFKFWPSARSSLPSNVARAVSFGLFLPFMLWGLWLSRPRWRLFLPCYLFIATYTAVHLASWALVRYRLPLDAVAMVFAALPARLLTSRTVPS